MSNLISSNLASKPKKPKRFSGVTPAAVPTELIPNARPKSGALSPGKAILDIGLRVRTNRTGPNEH